MIVLDLDLHVAALDAGVKSVGGVGRDFRSEEVERQAVVQVGFFLDRRQINDTQVADFIDVVERR